MNFVNNYLPNKKKQAQMAAKQGLQPEVSTNQLHKLVQDISSQQLAFHKQLTTMR